MIRIVDQNTLNSYIRESTEAMSSVFPLERNLSNFEDILKCLRDDNLLQEMVNRCYRDIVSSGKYSDSILGAGVEALCEILFAKKKFLSCAA
jgi:hypothetical protein